MAGRAPGRASDDAVTWYCHMRVSQMLAEGYTQKRIAELADLPKSAINFLVKNGKGVGATTAKGLAKAFGYRTRGMMVDQADAWWDQGGSSYAVQQARLIERARALKLLAEHKNDGNRERPISEFPGAPTDEEKTG